MFKVESSFFFFGMLNLIAEALRESKREMNNATRGNAVVSLLILVLNFDCYHHIRIIIIIIIIICIFDVI